MHDRWARSFALCIGAITLGAGCNHVFGIRETGEQDAAPREYFDAPTDAPFACPPLDEVPHFSRLVNQIAQDCGEITLSSPPSALLARCGPTYELSYGPLDGSVTPIEVMGLPAGASLSEARLVPEGDRMYARRNVLSAASLIELSRDAGTGAWSESLEITVPGGVAQFIQLGIPSRGPVRRVMVLNGTSNIVELEVPTTGVATEVASYTFAELGVYSMFQVPSLSENGLRLIYSGEDSQAIQHATYNVRASIADRFTRPGSLPELPRVYDLYMNTDCSRIYFSGLSSVFWVMRQ